MTALVGTPERPLRVAVVGSGPSGFYAIASIYKRAGLEAKVDLFDRLPTPYGLVRGGVAPDHQNIKVIAKKYHETAQHPGFRFFGHTRIGKDITVAELAERYDAIVWAVGNESDKRLGIPGEDLPGVHSATELVGWYNGHPDYRDRSFALDRAHRVVVIGNGNVSMDVARILARDAKELADSDIAHYAHEVLEKSTVEEVVVLGRRGPAEAAFSPKEVKELGELDARRPGGRSRAGGARSGERGVDEVARSAADRDQERGVPQGGRREGALGRTTADPARVPRGAGRVRGRGQARAREGDEERAHVRER